MGKFTDFFKDTIRESASEHDKQIRQEAIGYQYYHDVEIACLMLLDMKKKESEVKDLLHKYFLLNDFNELDQIVANVKESMKKNKGSKE